MTHNPAYVAQPVESKIPIRRITAADLRASLADGLADFREKRGDLLFVGLLYPLIGLATAVYFSGGRNIALLFPLFAGLTLLGPLVASGFYELAKRRERGQDSNWWHFFDVFNSKASISIAAVGIGMIGIFCAWIASAAVIYTVFFGPEPPASLTAFLSDLFTTSDGWGMIILGNIVGAVFAVIVLAVSVVSLPLLVDRNVGAAAAVGASLRAFIKNPVILLRWGIMVAAILFVAAIPLLIGLAFALPVLGYATWHLYTRIVARDVIEG